MRPCNLALPRVVFVTDPLCSWCWGMLPQMLDVRSRLQDEALFDLMMAGMQIGGPRPLAEHEFTRLKSLWAEVSETTGQRFSGRLPADETFVYHSEMACRAVEAMRICQSEPPWEFFLRLQQAFYLQALNINKPSVVRRLVKDMDVSEDDFLKAYESSHVREHTRALFDEAKRLGAHALPTVLLDLGEGPKLVSGGYVSTEFLLPDLEARIASAANSQAG